MSTTGIWPPLHDDTKQGDPVAKIRGDEYARICRVLNTIQIVGGTLVKTASGKDWMLIIDNTIYDFDPRFDGENIYRTAGHRCATAVRRRAVLLVSGKSRESRSAAF